MGVTISDIAKYSGVSVSTVSRVINEDPKVAENTREKVLNIINEYNYSPNIFAKSLSKNESNTIGIIIPDITNPFFGDIIKGVSEVVDRHNLNMTLYNTDEDTEKEKRHLKTIKAQRLKGLIMTPTSDLNDTEYLELVKQLEIPIVLLDRDIKELNLDGVFIDNYGSALEATEMLINNGHERIALISGPENSKPGRDRKKGYIDALKNVSLGIDEKIIIEGDFKFNSGYEAAKNIIAMEKKPSAIFCVNNMMTLGCMKALNESNYEVPNDISLMGFDEIDIFNIFETNISTIKRPTLEMGRIAMELLIKKFIKKDKDSPEKIILKTEIILKGSELKIR